MYFLLPLLLLLTSVEVVFADESLRPTHPGIEEIVVTARKRPEPLQVVPIPTTVVSESDFATRRIEDLSDLTRLVPNLLYDKSSANQNAAEVSLRGMTQVNFGVSHDPRVALYVDEVYVGRSQGSVFDLLDIERVEVLRGPQGTLFGRNTPAGAVHVITRQPTDERMLKLSVGAGNDGQQELSGIFNFPINDHWRFRLSGQHREADGYMENIGTGDDWNNENVQQYRASLVYEPNDQFRARLTLDHQKADEHPGLGDCDWLGSENPFDYLGIPGLTVFAVAFGTFDEILANCQLAEQGRAIEGDPDQSELDGTGAALNLNWMGEHVDVVSISSYREMEYINGSFGFGGDAPGGPGIVDLTQVEDSDYEQWSQELRFSGSALEDRLEWVAGIYLFEEDLDEPTEFQLFKNSPVPGPLESPLFYFPLPFGTFGDIALFIQGSSGPRLFSATNESWAVFSEIIYRATDRLSVTVGARYTEDERTYSHLELRSDGSPNFVCPPDTEQIGFARCEKQVDFDEITPRLIVDYQLNNQVMLYGSWSRGYASGGINDEAAMPTFDPEISNNYELGFKSRLAGDELLFNTTVFYNDYEDRQETVLLTRGGVENTAALVNADEAEIYGIETELVWQASENWRTRFMAGWLDGEYKEFTATEQLLLPPTFELTERERDFSDQEVVKGSHYNYGVNVEYSRFLDGGSRLAGSVGWSYRGESHWDALSTQDGYGLLDATFAVGFADNRMEIRLWGTNLLDEDYRIFTLQNGDVSAVNYWGEPRRYGLTLTYQFQ